MSQAQWDAFVAEAVMRFSEEDMDDSVDYMAGMPVNEIMGEQ